MNTTQLKNIISFLAENGIDATENAAGNDFVFTSVKNSIMSPDRFNSLRVKISKRGFFILLSGITVKTEAQFRALTNEIATAQAFVKKANEIIQE